MGRRSKKFTPDLNQEKDHSNKKSKVKIEEKTSKSNQHSDESKAKLFYELGYRYRILEKWLNSADAFEKSLDIYKRLKDYQKVSAVELTLGEMLIQGEKLDKAKCIFEKYLKAHPGNLIESGNSARASQGMGQIAMRLGKNKEAEENFKFSLSICKKYTGENSVFVGFALNMLSRVYIELENLTEAEKHITEALKIFNSITEDDAEMKLEADEAVAELNSNLAEVCKKTKRYAKAESHFKEAIKFYGSLPDEKYCKNAAKTLNTCGNMNFKQEKYIEAKEYWEKAMKIAESIEYHAKIAEILINFGMLSLAHDKPSEAEKNFEEALKIQKRYFGAESKQVVKTQEFLKKVAIYHAI